MNLKHPVHEGTSTFNVQCVKKAQINTEDMLTPSSFDEENTTPSSPVENVRISSFKKVGCRNIEEDTLAQGLDVVNVNKSPSFPAENVRKLSLVKVCRKITEANIIESIIKLVVPE